MIGSRGSGVRGPPCRLLSRRDEVALRGRASADGSASPRSRREWRCMDGCLDGGGGRWLRRGAARGGGRGTRGEGRNGGGQQRPTSSAGRGLWGGVRRGMGGGRHAPASSAGRGRLSRFQLLRHPKAGRPGPGVHGQFLCVGSDRPAGEEEERGPVSAGAEGLLGRTETVLSCDVECVLDKGVLERVKGDDPKTPTGPEERYGGLQPMAEALQLVVDLDAERLEGPGGGMDPLGPAAAGDGLLHQLSKLLGRGHRASPPLPDDGPGDRGGEPLLAGGGGAISW